MYISEDRYIAHYGVKGMKWGVRRYEDERVRKARSGLQSAHLQKGETRKESVRIAKKELSDAKDQAKLNSSKNRKISKREASLTQKYIQEGMTKEEATLAAYKRARTEKAIAIVGGLTVAGAAAYLTKQGISRNVDSYIKAGTKIQNLNTHNPKSVEQAFYGALKRGDKAIYKGLYATNLESGSPNVFNTTFQTTQNIKLASEKSARKVVDELIRTNPTYKANLTKDINNVKNAFMPGSKQSRLMKKAAADLAKGKTTKSVYDAQNVLLGVRGGSTNSTFYNTLKSKGYGAVRDVNDMRYSEVKSKASTIVFDTAKAKVAGSTKMTPEEIDKASAKQIVKRAFINKTNLASAGIGGAAAAANAAGQSKKDTAAVKAYRQKHPNSNMSYNEILNMLNQSKKKR